MYHASVLTIVSVVFTENAKALTMLHAQNKIGERRALDRNLRSLAVILVIASIVVVCLGAAASLASLSLGAAVATLGFAILGCAFLAYIASVVRRIHGDIMGLRLHVEPPIAKISTNTGLSVPTQEPNHPQPTKPQPSSFDDIVDDAIAGNAKKPAQKPPQDGLDLASIDDFSV